MNKQKNVREELKLIRNLCDLTTKPLEDESVERRLAEIMDWLDAILAYLTPKIVMKLTTDDERIFYNADYSPQLIAETLRRCPGWRNIELVEMTEAEYNHIPATNESAELFRSNVTVPRKDAP